MHARWLLLLLAASPAGAEVLTFESEDSNIRCSLADRPGGGDLYCVIATTDAAPAEPRPEDCVLDWGNSFFMTDSGEVQILCEMVQPNLGAGTRVPAGTTVRSGAFSCTATEGAIDCRNGKGHGFFLSRASQRVF
ncbi:MAG: hypothetical protein H6895_07030 [Defluviimonas sp.]|uniref:DUF6636 domain-containing protein n=1 Tax=Albidovulum sp. TaxID=1872424 RepID=UPI002A2F737C|nr:hypothetical protein [Defluviimonas sp.]